MSTVTKLNYTNETKDLIKDSLNQFGAGITDEDTFRSYVDKIKGIYNNWPRVTGTGTELILTPTKKAKMNIDLKGNTSQNSTTGKNLLPYPYTESTKEVYGITYTARADGTILVNGTSTNNNASFSLLGNYQTTNQKPLTGDYISGGTNQVRLRVSNHTGSTYTTLATDTGNGAQIDKTTYNTGYIELYVPSGTTVNNVVIKPMLLNSLEDTSYEPYTGAIPSPNPSYPQDIHTVTGNNTIKVSGKNLLDLKDGTYTNNGITAVVNNGEITLNGTDSGNATNFLNIPLNTNVNWVQGENYTISLNNPVAIGESSGSPYCTFRINNGGQLDTRFNPINSVDTKIIDKNDMFTNMIAIRTNSGITYNNFKLKPQIELGSTATTYEAYSETNYSINLGSIELCKINTYQDYIYKSNDKWYKKAYIGKVVLDGNERQWAYYTSNSLRVYALRTDLNNIDYKAELGLICFANYYQGKGQVESFDDLYNLDNNSITFRTDYTQLAIRNDEIENLLDFVTWLSSHNITLYYVLETPTDIEITETTLISQLNAIEQAKSNNDTTYISQTNADLPFIISASALKGGN